MNSSQATTTTSPEQLAANRANSLLSTGPATEEGKARSSQNARVHGLCSRQLHIAGEEETAVFTSLRDALTNQLAPVGELELIHFETIIHAQWNLRRCRMNEASLLGSVPDPFLDRDTRAGLKTLAVYSSRHERTSSRALKELKALQTERAVRTGFVDDAEPSPLIETSRVRRVLLGEIRAQAATTNTAAPPVSGFPFGLAPPPSAVAATHPMSCA